MDELKAEDLNAEQLRESLTTDAARRAFDKLDALKPDWIATQFEDGVYLSSRILKAADDPKAANCDVLDIESNFHKTFDDAVIAEERAVMAAAFKGLICVNRHSENDARVYLYSSRTAKFHQCLDPKPEQWADTAFAKKQRQRGPGA